MVPRSQQKNVGPPRAEILDQVVRGHRAHLLRQARKHSQRPENVDDALDDACVLFLRNYDGPPGIDALRYLMVVVKTAAWNIDRQSRRREWPLVPTVYRTDLKVDVTGFAADSGEEPEDRYERKDELRRRAALLHRLKPDERTALFLFAAGYSYREIAARQRWTHTKVNRCIAEGRARLHSLLTAEEAYS